MILSRACLVSAPAATQALQHFSRAFLGTAAAGQRRDTPRGACFLSSTAGTAGAGSLYMTGFSNVGALGLGPDSKRVNKPTLVETSEKVKDVACGRKFTLFATQVPSQFPARPPLQDSAGAAPRLVGRPQLRPPHRGGRRTPLERTASVVV
jgi:hypothetical protein